MTTPRRLSCALCGLLTLVPALRRPSLRCCQPRRPANHGESGGRRGDPPGARPSEDHPEAKRRLGWRIRRGDLDHVAGA